MKTNFAQQSIFATLLTNRMK